MVKEWHKTATKGLRYRFHPTRTRKKGIKVERDMFFQFRRVVNGRRIEEGLGWLFDGMTLEKAVAKVHELTVNAQVGEGPVTLAEKRKIQEEKKREQERIEAEERRAKITFADVWAKYLKQATADRGSKPQRFEEPFFRLWISPIIGDLPLIAIAPIHLEKVKATMAKAGKAPRTIQYALAIVRQVFNYAKRHDLFTGDNPVSKVRMPKVSNGRMRFLTHEEAEALLDELKKSSVDVHDQALLSLHSGLRAGEVFNLTWGCVDTERGLLTLLDTKSGKTRAAFMTDAVKEMLTRRKRGEPTDLVFIGRGGKKIVQISETFNRTVARLGLNAGIEDKRQKVVFHTLRHTYASWLVENGTDLYAVKELLGHSDFKMTSRYAHLGQNTLQMAVKGLEASLNGKKGGKVIPMPSNG